MAEKRMFSKKFISRDDFLSMPDSSQNLYIHLSLNADDDGFVDNVQAVLKTTQKKIDDLNILIYKNFIIPFQSGVLVITHWKMNNTLRNDRYKETVYQEEKKLLELDEISQIYRLKGIGIPLVDQRYTVGIPNITEHNITKHSVVVNTDITNIRDSEKFEKQQQFENFKKEFPQIIIDTEFGFEHDILLVCEKLKESKDWLLNPNNSFKLSFLIENYDALIKNFYKDRDLSKATDKQQKAFIPRIVN